MKYQRKQMDAKALRFGSLIFQYTEISHWPLSKPAGAFSAWVPSVFPSDSRAYNKNIHIWKLIQ
jgi:hypothetical protein